MGTNRYLNTSFWEDDYIVSLSPKEKLLYLYLLTNTRTNIAGMYKTSVRFISFDTGLSEKDILKALEGFQEHRKVLFIEKKFIIITNFIRHQKWNPNIKKGILECVNNLPDFVKSFIDIELDKPFKDFQRLLKSLNYSNLNINTNTKLNKNLKKQKDKNKKLSKPKDPKKHYAEFVKMTEKEYKQLVHDYSKRSVDESIRVLDNYKGANGKKYKSDYHAILSWVLRKVVTEMTGKDKRRRA